MPKLTKKIVDAAKSDKERDYFVWDDEVIGFGLRVMRSGRKSFQIQYRHSGRTRRMSIGKQGTITVETARKKAKVLLGRVSDGENPAEEHAVHRTALTVSDVCDRFLNEYVPTHCKKRTEEEYGRAIRLHIRPAIGNRKITDITRPDIAKLHHEMRKRPYQANRSVAILSVLFNQCEIWGFRQDGSNPCRHIQKYEEKSRERYLSREELKRLWETLDKCEKDKSESSAACNAYRLLLLTGCRLSEIQTLKWDYIKDDGIYLPDSKTGAKRVHVGKAVHNILDAINPIEDNPYVIVGAVKGHHLNNLQKPWRRIRKKAKLPDLRIHDLRHSFASFGLASGLSLAEIGKLLGHTQAQTTARYAHLADEYAAKAAERTTEAILDILDAAE